MSSHVKISSKCQIFPETVSQIMDTCFPVKCNFMDPNKNALLDNLRRAFCALLLLPLKAPGEFFTAPLLISKVSP